MIMISSDEKMFFIVSAGALACFKMLDKRGYRLPDVRLDIFEQAYEVFIEILKILFDKVEVGDIEEGEYWEVCRVKAYSRMFLGLPTPVPGEVKSKVEELTHADSPTYVFEPMIEEAKIIKDENGTPVGMDFKLAIPNLACTGEVEALLHLIDAVLEETAVNRKRSWCLR